MARQVKIAAQLRDWGLKVSETSGWEQRGSRLFAPRGVLGHHTAASQGHDAPSLNVCTNGRPDLKGPLCNVLIGRDGTCHVVAAGRANHAGRGRWGSIISGNRQMFGIEVENDGLGEPWSDEVMEAFDRAAAALLALVHAPAKRYCGHREYALPKGRKPDPAGVDLDAQRARIAVLLGENHQGDDEMNERQEAAVRRIQKAVGVKVDGDPGAVTAQAVEARVAELDKCGTDLAACQAEGGKPDEKTAMLAGIGRRFAELVGDADKA